MIKRSSDQLGHGHGTSAPPVSAQGDTQAEDGEETRREIIRQIKNKSTNEIIRGLT